MEERLRDWSQWNSYLNRWRHHKEEKKIFPKNPKTCWPRK